MKTFASTIVGILLLLAGVSSPSAQTTGRTDGPEESEFGMGGYPFGGPAGRFYISPAFGSGIFHNTAGNASQSGLLYGFDLGYEKEGWIGIQAGYSYVSELQMSVFSLGSRLSTGSDPFVYYFSTQAGLYAPEETDKRFGIAPGAGIDILVNDKLRIGLNYKHDFMFSSGTTEDMDRVYAGLKIYF